MLLNNHETETPGGVATKPDGNRPGENLVAKKLVSAGGYVGYRTKSYIIPTGVCNGSTAVRNNIACYDRNRNVGSDYNVAIATEPSALLPFDNSRDNRRALLIDVLSGAALTVGLVALAVGLTSI